MRTLIISILFIAGVFMMQSCVVQNHANTIERDKDNPCIVHIVLQVGIDGTDADVVAVRDQLESCYDKTCFIPCKPDSAVGCKTMINVIVKKWSALSSDEQKNFHHITMIDNDGLPSNAHIGSANGEPSWGTWRRNEPPRTYCHEALHLLGLDDQYCSRLYNAVDSSVVTEVTCKPPPDPANGNCCTPTAQNTRCGQPCPGHENDLMATLTPELSCSNIMDVLKKAGFDNCPEECCKSKTPYHASDQIFGGPAYMHFGDKDTHFGSYGLNIEYTKMVKPSIGITINAGGFTHTEKDITAKQTSQHLNITAGITYYPKNIFKTKPKLIFSTHALFGISNWTQKTTISSYGTTKTSDQSFNANIGAALDLRLNSSWNFRLLQADYSPTFFGKTTQSNYRLTTGICYKFSHRQK